MVDVLKETLGEESINTFSSIRTLAVYIAKQGREDEALPLFAQALTLARQTYPSTSVDLTHFIDSYGSSLTRSDHFEQAESMFHEALDILHDAGPAGEENKAIVKESMIRLYTIWNEREPNEERQANLESLIDDQ